MDKLFLVEQGRSLDATTRCNPLGTSGGGRFDSLEIKAMNQMDEGFHVLPCGGGGWFAVEGRPTPSGFLAGILDCQIDSFPTYGVRTLPTRLHPPEAIAASQSEKGTKRNRGLGF